MAKAEEKVIGTFLYAASAKSYEVHRLIFTSSRIIELSLSWEKANILGDILNMLYVIFTFPFQGNISTDPLLKMRWNEIKDQNSGRSVVDYNGTEYEEILKKSLFQVILHEISTTPYSMIKSISVANDIKTSDYKVMINGGFLNRSVFIIPSFSVQEFKDLVAKAPIASKIK